MASVNAAAISSLNTAWDARTGAYRPPVSRFSEGKAAISLVASGNAVLKVFTVAHTLAQRPTYVVAEGQTPASLLSHTVTTTATNVVITFKVAPVSAASNVSFIIAAAY